MKSSILAVIMTIVFAHLSQAQFDDYKYLVVPKKFNAFSKENQHQTSTLVKHLFTQKGFTTLYDDQFPDDLNSNRCLGLYAQIIDNSSMFLTKTIVVLKDCKGQEVFMTQEGTSKSKEYKEAYKEAIEEAFESFETIDYQYRAKAQQTAPITISFKNDVKKLEDQKTVKEPLMPERKGDAVLVQEATKEQQTYKSAEPIPSDYRKEAEPIGKFIGDDEILYAQDIPNGYQLVDNKPSVRLKMYRTSLSDIYTTVHDGFNGLVYKKEGKWFLEYYLGDKLTSQELNIKF